MHYTIHFGVKGKVFPGVNIFRRVMLHSSLAYDDVSGNSCLTTKDLNA
jgi:hypothetical protein